MNKILSIIRLVQKFGFFKTAEVVKNTGKTIDGYKMMVSGIMYLLLAFLGIVVTMFPDLASVLPQGFDTSGFANHLIEGILVIGAAHKGAKITSHISTMSESMKTLTEILGGDPEKVIAVLASLKTLEGGKNE
jgi:hypothetical protein